MLFLNVLCITLPLPPAGNWRLMKYLSAELLGQDDTYLSMILEAQFTIFSLVHAKILDPGVIRYYT